MSDFLHQITTLSWWLGVVVVGIAINLISSWLPKVYSRVSKRYRDNFEKKKALEDKERENRINLLVRHPERLDYFMYELIYKQILRLGFMVVAFAIFPIGILATDPLAKVLSLAAVSCVLFMWLKSGRLLDKESDIFFHARDILYSPLGEDELQKNT